MIKITLIACGNKMPSWVNEAVMEYSKRLQEFAHVHFLEIPLLKRSKSSDLTRILDKETTLIHSAIPNGSRIIALDLAGDSYSSEKLASRLEQLQLINSHWCFLIGGPEGLAPSILDKADESWSLSKLTFPHPLVRIILLETLYRAWSIIHNHPYHK